MRPEDAVNLAGGAAADFPFLPFDEAIGALQRRGHKLIPSGHWAEVWQAAHHTGFTVARSAGFDILGDIHKALRRAQDEGLPFEQFQKELGPILQKKGWWGVTEEGVQLGSPRRLRTIYDVNMRVSAAQGNWERQQRLKNERPYLRYVAQMKNTRPLHAAWHGTVLHIDHPWWKTHYPPNGWNCHCGAEDLSEDDVRRFGYAKSKSAPDDGMEDWVHPISRDARRVPKGIDPGWDYNPGDTAQSHRVFTNALQKISVLPPNIGAQALERIAPLLPALELQAGSSASAVLQKIIATGLEAWMADPRGAFPLAIIPPEDAAIIGSTARVVKMTPWTLDKQRYHHPELTAQDYALVQEAVDKGEKFKQDDKNIAYALNKGGGVVVIVKATKVGDELYVVSMRRMSEEIKKRERVLIQLKK